MTSARLSLLARLATALAVLSWGADQSIRAAARSVEVASPVVTSATQEDPLPATTANAAAQGGKATGKVTRDQAYVEKFKKVAPSLKRDAAKQSRLRGLKPGIAGLAAPGALAVQAPDPGGVPHYFGPYANWAFSPLPKGPVATVTVVDGGSGYQNPVVTIDDAYLPGTAITPADVTAERDATTGAITGFTIRSGGLGYMAPVVTVTDDPARCGVAPLPACGTGALADAIIGGGTLTGGMPKFVDLLPGIPGVTLQQRGERVQPRWIERPRSVLTLLPYKTTYPGSDYYEIALVEYTEQMHSACRRRSCGATCSCRRR